MAPCSECVFCSPVSDCLPLLNEVDLGNLKSMIILKINHVDIEDLGFFTL